MEVTKPKICGSVKWLHCIYLKTKKQKNVQIVKVFLKIVLLFELYLITHSSKKHVNLCTVRMKINNNLKYLCYLCVKYLSRK
jgi:hypothetical protein